MSEQKDSSGVTIEGFHLPSVIFGEAKKIENDLTAVRLGDQVNAKFRRVFLKAPEQKFEESGTRQRNAWTSYIDRDTKTVTVFDAHVLVVPPDLNSCEKRFRKQTQELKLAARIFPINGLEKTIILQLAGDPEYDTTKVTIWHYVPAEGKTARLKLDSIEELPLVDDSGKLSPLAKEVMTNFVLSRFEEKLTRTIAICDSDQIKPELVKLVQNRRKETEIEN